ncbi:MAG: ATP-binding protein [Planctomycetaceae bacterium]
MFERLYRRFPAAYSLLMIYLTRLTLLAGGLIIVAYVCWATRMPDSMRTAFATYGTVQVIVAVLLTIPLAHWHTRHFRPIHRQLIEGQPFDPKIAAIAVHEASSFPRRQSVAEVLIAVIAGPAISFYYLEQVFVASADLLVLMVLVALHMIAAIVVMTFLSAESWIRPPLKALLRSGVEPPGDLPSTRIKWRMVICFGLIVSATCVTIGAQANQRAHDIVRDPINQVEAVLALRNETLFIAAVALMMGFLYSQYLSTSVSSRVNELVELMRRVEKGDLTQRAYPAGTDELDILSRQFNAMTEQLQRKDSEVRRLQATLEQQVVERTEQLRESMHQLQISNQHQTEFFSNVSHELRTPLMMIVSPIEQFLSESLGRLDERTESLLRMAQLNGQKLLRLINQLLDVSKADAGMTELDVEPVNMVELCQRIITEARQLADRRNITLTCITPEFSEQSSVSPVTLADEAKIDSVITNLISNALKFTPEQGEVTLRLELLPLSDSLHDDDWEFRIAVEDTGIGISKDQQQRLFQRFIQAEGTNARAHAGTGLGLAIVKEFVELHRGQVFVESAPGQGSTFGFTIPRVDRTDCLLPSSPLSSAKLQTVGRFPELCEIDARYLSVNEESAGNLDAEWSVLIVDDMPEVRQVIGSILKSRYRLYYAANGLEGLAVVSQMKPDLILSDVTMPELDGHAFCRRVRENPETKTIPFLLLSARAKTVHHIEGLEAGADEYLSKPVDPAELLARVDARLRIRRLHIDLEDRNIELQATLEELRLAQDQLVQSEKMSSLGQLMAGLAHEINNSINAVSNGIEPLTIRIGQLREQMLSEAGPTHNTPDDRARRERTFQQIDRLTQAIAHGADRTVKIVGDMKVFSHPGRRETDTLDVNQSLELTVSLMRGEFWDRIVVERNFGELPLIHGPFRQIGQVFLNLLNNAVQAIDGTGTITLSTRQKGGRIEVSIRDTGTGIPPDIQNRIFDPFFTTKEPGKGTGLGLSLCYRIVRDAGGRIRCFSEPGKGTEFIVELPLNATSSDRSPSSALIGWSADETEPTNQRR